MRFADLETNRELYETFIELLADGATREKIGEVLGVNKATVSEWKKRPEVQQDLGKRIQERANEVLRHTDSKIAAKLQAGGDKLSIDQLLKVRHEFAGDNVNLKVTGDGAKALTDLLNEVDRNPAAAAALSKLLPSGERV